MNGENEHRCGAKKASCVCTLPDGHESKWHQCECGGEWSYASGKFEARALPGSASEWDGPFVSAAKALGLL